MPTDPTLDMLQKLWQQRNPNQQMPQAQQGFDYTQKPSEASALFDNYNRYMQSQAGTPGGAVGNNPLTPQAPAGGPQGGYGGGNQSSYANTPSAPSPIRQQTYNPAEWTGGVTPASPVPSDLRPTYDTQGGVTPGGYQGTGSYKPKAQMTGMVDTGSGLGFQVGPNGQWYPAGAGTGGPGMSFNNAQTLINQRQGQDYQNMLRGFVPNPQQQAVQDTLMMLPPEWRINPDMIQWAQQQQNVAAQHGLGQQEMALKWAELNQRTQAAKDALDPLKPVRQSIGNVLSRIDWSQPNASQQAMQAVQGMSEAADSEQFRRALGGGTPGGGPAPGGGTGGPGQGLDNRTPPVLPKNSYELMDALNKTFAGNPDLAQAVGEKKDASGQFRTKTNDLLTNIYLYDKAHPGFMKTQGQNILNQLRSSRGANAVEDFAKMNVGDRFGALLTSPWHTLTAHTLHGDMSNEELARRAWANAMGVGWPGSTATPFLK